MPGKRKTSTAPVKSNACAKPKTRSPIIAPPVTCDVVELSPTLTPEPTEPPAKKLRKSKSKASAAPAAPAASAAPTMDSSDETSEAAREYKRAKLMYLSTLLSPFLFVNFRAFFKPAKANAKAKCHGCRTGGLEMPGTDDDNEDDAMEVLDCGCTVELAMLEACVLKLGIIHKGGRKGHITLGRAHRDHIWAILEKVGLSPLDALLDAIPRSDF
jgi:hypothetical protein